MTRFRRISDQRSTRNLRHPLASILALAACGVAVVGGDSIIAVWHWASDACPQEVLAELEVWRDPFTGLHVPPSERTFRRVLGEVDGDELDREVCAYLAGQAPRQAGAPGHPDTPDAARPETAEPAEPAWSKEREARRARRRDRERHAVAGLLPGAAADGKAIRGARRADGRRPQLLSLFCHTRHATLAQRAIDTKTSEVPELKQLMAGVDLTGMVLTADALHTVRESARHLTEDLGAYYVMILKDNQPALLAAAMAVLAAGTDAEHERAGTGHTEIERGHGRSERRTIRTAPADGVDFPGAVQVMRIVRHIADLHGSGRSKEVAYAITNLPAHLAGPAHLGTYVRRRWGVEAMHHVRDVTFREDAGQIRTGSLPQVMATCRNLAIGAFRHVGHVNMAHARRHYRNDARRLLTLFDL
ncbi:ISAs1 family transposase [Acrocarpospora pleiomorpha]|uniref:ISAs1 family transposase n=1 Tax=Acrocarpospora pleiomorpha TaxID=90975 RepID=A0A5M3Y2G4_9ACTN|nr:ISAs1 family transposase [Acrocarpospora pleiomorpha]GES27492.1 ISAs1 family transposase [Acrocarpospora pleiomorpha]